MTPVNVVVGFEGGVYVVGVMIDSEEDEDQEDDDGYGGREDKVVTALELDTPVP